MLEYNIKKGKEGSLGRFSYPSLTFHPRTWCAAERGGRSCFWWSWRRRSLCCWWWSWKKDRVKICEIFIWRRRDDRSKPCFNGGVSFAFLLKQAVVCFLIAWSENREGFWWRKSFSDAFDQSGALTMEPEEKLGERSERLLPVHPELPSEFWVKGPIAHMTLMRENGFSLYGSKTRWNIFHSEHHSEMKEGKSLFNVEKAKTIWKEFGISI